jgi:hypothetical protein
MLGVAKAHSVALEANPRAMETHSGVIEAFPTGLEAHLET